MRRWTVCLCLLLGYILGIRDGYITLWSEDSNVPKVFPYRAEMMPPADQRVLEQGIYIPDGSKLAQLLEDYLS